MKKKYLLFVVLCIGVMLLPFLLEVLIVNNNIPSSFENSEWFAFWGGYVGSIITIITVYITVKIENKKTRQQLIKQYENSKLEKEMECATKIKNIVMLDGYRFNYGDKKDLLTEYRIFSRDYFAIQTDLKKLEWISDSATYRDKFYKEINLIAKSQVFILVNRTKNYDENYIEGIVKDIKELSILSNNYRHSLNELYDNYIDEMMKKMYGI